jgi:hypothetical protein
LAPITLCIWPANGEPAHGVPSVDYRGIAISYWNDGKNEFWAASADASADLRRFTQTLAAG